MTIQEATKQLVFQLFHIYEEREANNIADLVMENITEWKRIDRVMNKGVTLSAQKEQLLHNYIQALSNNKPVQYVLNEAWFYGMKLYVDENVLIPRPETEELVNWVYEDRQSGALNLHILDVGTGSGCIALALKKKLPEAEIFACDISVNALEVAKKNAGLLHLGINFIHSNFLTAEAFNILPAVDVLVSNPPYIPLQDKTAMHANVMEHEPHLALFVQDHDPLVFYKAIADYAQTNLREQGAVYVEIHELMGNAVSTMFREEGFKNIEVRKDLQGKDRMVKAGFQAPG